MSQPEEIKLNPVEGALETVEGALETLKKSGIPYMIVFTLKKKALQQMLRKHKNTWIQIGYNLNDHTYVMRGVEVDDRVQNQN